MMQAWYTWTFVRTVMFLLGHTLFDSLVISVGPRKTGAMFHGKQQVAGNCGPKGCEVVHTLKRLVDGDEGWGFNFLAHDVGLLNANGERKFLTGMRGLFHQTLEP